MEEGERAAYRRRFSTLFVDDTSQRAGTYGSVAWALDATGEPCALKVLDVSLRAQDDVDDAHDARIAAARAAFRVEYESHRNLAGMKGFPKLYGYGFVDGAPAIVMEWVEGVTLAQARRELALDAAGRLSPLTVARLGRELFGLLLRLNLMGDGCVHGDISPSNIMIRTAHRSLRDQEADGSFDLCLIDFGSMMYRMGASSLHAKDAHAIRAATVAYAAPELLDDDDAARILERESFAIDVFAAASVLFELVAGEVPFDVSDTACGDKSMSPAEIKTRLPVRRLVSVHETCANMADLLTSEPDVAVATGRVAVDLALAPEDDAVRQALVRVDGQMEELLTACLAPLPGRRPSAEAVRDALTAYCVHYADNIERSLCGERLLPCTDGASWFASLSPYALNRLLFTVGTAASYAVLVVVVVATTLIAGGSLATWECGPLAWTGHLEPLALCAALLAPVVLGRVACGGDRFSRAGFRKGSVALWGCALVLLVASRCLTIGSAARPGGLSIAVVTVAAASWCPLVLGYALTLAPSMLAERYRARIAARAQSMEDGSHVLEHK